MNSKDISYPAVSISIENWIGFIENREAMRSCTKKGLNSGHYNQLRILDSDGWDIRVLSVKKVGYRNFPFGFDFLLNQHLIVELELAKESKKVSFEQIREIIVDAIKKKTSFWSSGGNLAELIKEIREADSVDKMRRWIK